MAITSAFQADDAGSIPAVRSNPFFWSIRYTLNLEDFDLFPHCIIFHSIYLRTKQRLNFNAEDLILEGYVDKPNCPVCSMNLEHFEGVGPGKLAKEIRIMHLSKELHDSLFRDRRQNVVDEITSCE